LNFKKEKEMSEKEQWVLKFCLLGDHAVGKTSLISQYIDRTFEEDYKPTIGVNIIKKTIRLEQINSDVNLIIWDIAWQEKYEKYRKFYFEGCAGALLVYDITRKPTFERINSKWLLDFKNHVGKRKTSHILIGNKIDLTNERVVPNEDGVYLAKAIEAADFIETSAKFGQNVEIAFVKLVQQILGNYGVQFEL
jgi:Ras-related protein Rab-11A